MTQILLSLMLLMALVQTQSFLVPTHRPRRAFTPATPALRALEKNDDSSFDVLRKRISQMQETNGDSPKLRDCYCIMFNPRSDDEGIHTIEVPAGSGQNVLLAFEAKEDCVRFALVLEAQGFFNPCAEKLMFEEVESFCSGGGPNVSLQVVKAGEPLTPPEMNKENIDFVPKDPDEGGKGGIRKARTVDDDLSSLRASLNRSFELSGEDGGDSDGDGDSDGGNDDFS
ncbi:hypothetical protein TrST_g6509 [Triparma strigata]|uniref:Uncharacterized protein n=1 Tax=Triparma strigata TaxID=1606541 RepID=A0A9W7EGZ0_9STRA|nr:hypothetical protein TrST_g6509 [Triparma strigata]